MDAIPLAKFKLFAMNHVHVMAGLPLLSTAPAQQFVETVFKEAVNNAMMETRLTMMGAALRAKPSLAT